MKPKTLCDGVQWMGTIDWDRRLFDALVPLPDGTSYNAYFVRGSEKTALIDSTDPDKVHVLMSQLKDVHTVDYLISQHTEQDHSGSLPILMDKYRDARVLCSPKAKSMLVDHLGVDPERLDTMEDEATIDLGGRTLQFIHTPWVHWPETMSTHLVEDGVLFSCDFFGSHLATSDLCVDDEAQVYEPAKRYYAEIMMPFRTTIRRNLAKLEGRDIRMIAPSHGPVHRRPAFIMEAYKEWAAGPPRNLVLLPYVSMHGSTARMVEYLVAALAERDIRVQQYCLEEPDVGKLAIGLVDAATIILGTPTVLTGAHPAAIYAAALINALRPKATTFGMIGSYGWATKAAQQVEAITPLVRAERLEPVLARGLPRAEHFEALERLACAIAGRHQEQDLR